MQQLWNGLVSSQLIRFAISWQFWNRLVGCPTKVSQHQLLACQNSGLFFWEVSIRVHLDLLAAFPLVYGAVWLAEPCNPTCCLGCFPSGNSIPHPQWPTLRPPAAKSSNSLQWVNGIFFVHKQVFIFYEGLWRDWAGKSWSHLCAQYNMKRRRER